MALSTDNPVNLSPQEAWDKLKAGNERFANHQPTHPHMDEARRTEMTDGQNPIAVVFACSDSRVPVELIFDAGLGDIFVVRTAGQILGESIMGTISYAVNSLEVPLVVVLGHESCGAVKATIQALDRGEVPDDHRRTLVERVAPSILMGRAEGKYSIEDLERKHAAETTRQIIERMTRLRNRLRRGEVGVVAARYVLSEGKVEVVATYGVDGDTPTEDGRGGLHGTLKLGM